MPEQPRRANPNRPGRPQSGRGDRSGVGGLVGAGPSIVGVSGSMRARDVSRPGEHHDEQAEQSVVVRRREPVPPAETPPRPGARTPSSATATPRTVGPTPPQD